MRITKINGIKYEEHVDLIETHPSGAMTNMTRCNISTEDKKGAHGTQTKRNKTTDADGNRYDERKGKWSRIN